MKTILVSLLLFTSISSAYMLPTKIILHKTAENAGSGVYQIDQEVQFTNGSETLNLKETWLIENDRTMRVTVSGTKDLQSQIQMQFVYNGGQKYSQVGGKQSQKISADFLEKFLNFRSSDIFANSLVNLKIIPANYSAKKDTENFVRLSRAGGVVNYAFGEPTPAQQEDGNPGIWIEQDQFVIRKLRLPTQAEMTADNYTQFAKGLNYPRQRSIRWGENTVNIRLISASAKAGSTANLFQPSSLETNSKLDGLNNLPIKETVLEFYSRFR